MYFRTTFITKTVFSRKRSLKIKNGIQAYLLTCALLSSICCSHTIYSGCDVETLLKLVSNEIVEQLKEIGPSLKARIDERRNEVVFIENQIEQVKEVEKRLRDIVEDRGFDFFMYKKSTESLEYKEMEAAKKNINMVRSVLNEVAFKRCINSARSILNAEEYIEKVLRGKGYKVSRTLKNALNTLYTSIPVIELEVMLNNLLKIMKSEQEATKKELEESLRIFASLTLELILAIENLQKAVENFEKPEGNIDLKSLLLKSLKIASNKAVEMSCMSLAIKSQTHRNLLHLSNNNHIADALTEAVIIEEMKKSADTEENTFERIKEQAIIDVKGVIMKELIIFNEDPEFMKTKEEAKFVMEKLAERIAKKSAKGIVKEFQGRLEIETQSLIKKRIQKISKQKKVREESEDWIPIKVKTNTKKRIVCEIFQKNNVFLRKMMGDILEKEIQILQKSKDIAIKQKNLNEKLQSIIFSTDDLRQNEQERE